MDKRSIRWESTIFKIQVPPVYFRPPLIQCHISRDLSLLLCPPPTATRRQDGQENGAAAASAVITPPPKGRRRGERSGIPITVWFRRCDYSDLPLSWAPVWSNEWSWNPLPTPGSILTECRRVARYLCRGWQEWPTPSSVAGETMPATAAGEDPPGAKRATSYSRRPRRTGKGPDRSPHARRGQPLADPGEDRAPGRWRAGGTSWQKAEATLTLEVVC
ncbi:hypothetical protein QBC39DRAFT_72365 [Podospora conica]|nr:hypothetical protein QBC39DRAFT_72365 [Schizothecium conicum]